MQVIRSLILLCICIVLLLPLWIMVTGSFQELRFILAMPPRLIPWELTIENYSVLLKGTEVLRWTVNTLLVVTGTIAGAIILSASAGYGFSVYRFRGRSAMLAFLVAMIVMPGQVLIIPQFVMVRLLGLAGTRMAAILPRCLSVMGLVLMKNYIDHIPRDLIDAGRIMGAHELKIMTKLVLPQCSPVLGAIALFYGVMAFQDFLWQLLVLQRTATRTLIVGLLLKLRSIETTYNDIGAALSLGTIMFIPLLLVFMATHRAFMKGLTLEGMR